MSQRCHLYEYVIGWSPVQVPVVVLSVSPTSVLPLITGGKFDAGLSSGCTTTDVAADVAVVEPALFFALTRKRMRLPWSSPRTVYVTSVSPAMFLQVFDEESSMGSFLHWSHWYEYVMSFVLCQSPRLPIQLTADDSRPRDRGLGGERRTGERAGRAVRHADERHDRERESSEGWYSSTMARS